MLSLKTLSGLMICQVIHKMINQIKKPTGSPIGFLIVCLSWSLFFRAQAALLKLCVINAM